MTAPKRTLIGSAIAALAILILCPAPSGASEPGPGTVALSNAHTGRSSHAELTHFLLQPVTDPVQFAGKRIAIVASDGASAFELETARDYFMDRDARVHILTPRPLDNPHTLGMAALVPPHELISTLDYANRTRVVAVTWYLDQVDSADYDAVYVPNNLRDVQRLGSNAQVIRFLVGARAQARPIFVTGNAISVVPGLELAANPQSDGGTLQQVVLSVQAGDVYVGEGAFDMPRLIGALAATLTAKPAAGSN